MSARRLVAAVLGLALLGAMMAAGFWVRWQMVEEYPATAGDGIEYHRLAHELRRGHRYAYDPAPAPLSYSRTPGYSLVLTFLERPGYKDDKWDRWKQQPGDMPRIARSGTRLNVYFDMATTLLVFFVARLAGLRRTAYVAAALTLACPLLLLNCCYLLRESFSTALTMLDVALLVLAWRRRNVAALVGAGVVLGLAMLVRPDSITLAPAFLIPTLRLPGSLTARVRSGLLALVAAAVVYAPWPIRNQLAFGEPHWFGASWVDDRGKPLPTGFRTWMATWVDDLNQGYLNLRFIHHGRIERREIDARSYDSPDEEQQLMSVVARFNREGLTPGVDQDFRDLAWRRIKARTYHCLVYLPARRAALWWWHFPPANEQPLKSALLKQPARRDRFERASHAFAWLGALGWLVLLLRRQTREVAALFALVLVTRSLVMAWLGPDGGYQRYLAPVYPLLLVQAAVALTAPWVWLQSKLWPTSPH